MLQKVAGRKILPTCSLQHTLQNVTCEDHVGLCSVGALELLALLAGPTASSGGFLITSGLKGAGTANRCSTFSARDVLTLEVQIYRPGLVRDRLPSGDPW